MSRSARGNARDRVDGLELGANDTIVKPFVLLESLARVRAGLRRSAVAAAQATPVLFRGGMRIAIDRHRVVIGETELSLRPNEYGLLLALALEPGRVFSLQQLLDAVWDKDVIVDACTVDVHNSWLRGKLVAAGFDASTIGTIHGAGYPGWRKCLARC